MTQEISISRTIAATPEAVWDAVIRAENFAVWFGTEAVEVPLDTLEWDAVPGQRWNAVMQLPDGSAKPWTGEFVEVVAPERVVFTLTDVPDEPDGAVPVTITLTPVGSDVELTLTQQAPPGFGPEQIAAVTAGYGAFVDALVRIVADRG